MEAMNRENAKRKKEAGSHKNNDKPTQDREENITRQTLEENETHQMMTT